MNDIREKAASIVQVFEDYLQDKNIEIPNDEREEDADIEQAIIFGTDYYALEDEIVYLLGGE